MAVHQKRYRGASLFLRPSRLTIHSHNSSRLAGSRIPMPAIGSSPVGSCPRFFRRRLAAARLQHRLCRPIRGRLHPNRTPPRPRSIRSPNHRPAIAADSVGFGSFGTRNRLSRIADWCWRKRADERDPGRVVKQCRHVQRPRKSKRPRIRSHPPRIAWTSSSIPRSVSEMPSSPSATFSTQRLIAG